MKRIQKALQKEFSPKGILLEAVSSGMIDGWIISKSFEGMTGMERQQKVWKLFDTYLDEKDRARIGFMLTFTPLKKKMQFDDDFDGFRYATKQKSSLKKRR
ncbi:MAG: hypothetical protein ONB44_14630 [candidate division KSB1 bacterium]|nr:hypothetical protein [candidate division KSB1 bacterium]MDZ7303363.1 hypothetical protein [candidate division KSB1 bacterium]MDZ7312319.1 hypothetical protein [candidate division KSB1 bacterium]